VWGVDRVGLRNTKSAVMVKITLPEALSREREEAERMQRLPTPDNGR
jgi:hypothetical protein